MVNATLRPLYPPGKIPATHCIGGWVSPTEILAFTVLRTPDLRAPRQSLYHYTAPPTRTTDISDKHLSLVDACQVVGTNSLYKPRLLHAWDTEKPMEPPKFPFLIIKMTFVDVMRMLAKRTNKNWRNTKKDLRLRPCTTQNYWQVNQTQCRGHTLQVALRFESQERDSRHDPTCVSVCLCERVTPLSFCSNPWPGHFFFTSTTITTVNVAPVRGLSLL